MSEFLYATPDNPIPQGASSGLFETDDGRRLRHAAFPGDGESGRGTIVLMQGRNECIEKYYETIGDLQRQGFFVFTFDWIGQGGSDRLLPDRQRGYVKSFGRYVADLDALLRHVIVERCPGPIHIVGHSTGALIALLAAPALTGRIGRMVLIAPLLTIGRLPFSMSVVLYLTGLLARLGFGTFYLRGGRRPNEWPPFETNDVTSDRRRWRRNQAIGDAAPPLAMGGPTVAWVHAASVASRKVQDDAFAARIHVPSLLIAAGADRVVSVQAIEAYARKLRSGSLLVVDGAMHEILQEKDRYREQVLAAIDAFLPQAAPSDGHRSSVTG